MWVVCGIFILQRSVGEKLDQQTRQQLLNNHMSNEKVEMGMSNTEQSDTVLRQ